MYIIMNAVDLSYCMHATIYMNGKNMHLMNRFMV